MAKYFTNYELYEYTKYVSIRTFVFRKGNIYLFGSGSATNISASQMSFDNRIENMDKLIQLLSAQTGYAPNETNLKLTALTTLLADMRTKNTGAINTLTPLSNARIARNTILYATGTGLVDTAGEVKKYVKSVFGGTSPQYNQLKKVKFKAGSDLAGKVK